MTGFETASSQYREGTAERNFRSLPNPDEVFDSFSGTGNDVIDPLLVERDIAELLRLFAPLAAFADKEHAHLERKSVQLPLISNGNECLDFCWKLCQKYHVLFFAKPHMNEIGIGPELGWEERMERLRLSYER